MTYRYRLAMAKCQADHAGRDLASLVASLRTAGLEAEADLVDHYRYEVEQIMTMISRKIEKETKP